MIDQKEIQQNLNQNLEAILFVSSKFLKKSSLIKILNCSNDELEVAINNLRAQYKERQSGIDIMQDGDRVQMITSVATSELIKQYLKDERTGELSRPSLETLSIIAYRGPVTKVEIEMIRGVNCSLILRNLMIRGLIIERQDKKKGVAVYQVTFEFMQHLGISELKELPDFDKLNRDLKLGEVLIQQNKNSEDFFQNLEQLEADAETESEIQPTN